MADLIDRQAALDTIMGQPPEPHYPSWYAVQIEKLPAVHPEIIRCKDCKHKHVENMVWTCPFGLPGGENFFCGYGTEPYKGE